MATFTDTTTNIPKEPRTAGILTTALPYKLAHETSLMEAQKHNFVLASMPTAVYAITHVKNLRKGVREGKLDTTTIEILGLRDGKEIYEVWHNAPIMLTKEGMEEIVDAESKFWDGWKPQQELWEAMGKEYARVSIEEVKKGYTAEKGKPLVIYADPSALFCTEKKIGYSEFIQNDRILMLVGNKENQYALGDILFNTGAKGEECKFIENRQNPIPRPNIANPVYLGENNKGFCTGAAKMKYAKGRFLAVAPKYMQ